MNNNKGITLTALSISIIVLLILASITIYYGKESIDKANLENLKTNMLLIKAKAKEYCEEANFKLGTGDVPSDATKLQAYLAPGIKYLENKKENSNEAEDPDRPILNRIASYPQYIQYKEFVAQLDLNALKIMGLKDIENPSKYLIGFSISENKVEVYYTDGYEVDGTQKYSLAELENIE